MIFSFQVKKVIKLINVKSFLNYLIINFFLHLWRKLLNIFNNNKIILALKNPMQYLSQLFKNLFPKLIFGNISTKIGKIISFQQSRNSCGYD